jgi:hypothetical protein
MVLLARWTITACSPRILEDQRCERFSTSPIELRASDNRCSGRVGRGFSTSVQPLARTGDLQRVVQAGLLTEAEQQTHNAQQAIVNQNLGFIVNVVLPFSPR